MSGFHQPLILSLAYAGLLTSSLTANEAPQISSKDLHFFENKVRPLLSEHCYKCHSAESKKIKGDILLDRRAGWEDNDVVTPGKPDESDLIKMIEHDSDFDEMPPKYKMEPEEIAILREWVQRGAPDPRNEKVGEALVDDSFDLEERKKWWSLQPRQNAKPPAVTNEAWAATDIDRFILKALEDKSWKPAPTAGREQLLRRASITLTGLAPTQQELADFLKDEAPVAYERAVDRMMASPHFGERWARHWMDVVRFSESKAFEADYTMPYLDRYRDYLIRAFNDDVPFDQFIRESLAGDLITKPRLNPTTGHNESLIGPSFLTITDGQHGPPDIQVDEARVFDSIISASSIAFQGITLACARCHDHKFDAITAADYYSFYGMLRSSRQHYANIAKPTETKRALTELRSAKTALLATTMAGIEQQAKDLPAVIQALDALRSSPAYEERLKALRAPLAKGEKPEGRLAKFLTDSDPDISKIAEQHRANPATLKTWFGWLTKPSTPPELAALKKLLTGTPATAIAKSTVAPQTTKSDHQFGLTSSSLGEWTASGAGFASASKDGFIPSLNGDQPFRDIIGSGAVCGQLSGRTDGALRSPDFVLDGSPVELWARGENVEVRLIVRNYELVGFGPTTGRLRVGIKSKTWRKVSFATNLWKGQTAYLEILHHGNALKCIKPGARPPNPSDNAYAAVAVGSLPDSNSLWAKAAAQEESPKALIPSVIAHLARGTKDGSLSPAGRDILSALITEGLVQTSAQSSPPLLKALTHYREVAATVPTPIYVRSMVDGSDYHERVFVRGNEKDPSKEPNPRHFLDGLGGKPITSRGSGRLDWAELVAHSDNPLTARVRINRIWSRVFGRGLVSSIDDFGKMGELPSHPELLDFLANDFVASGWSTKAMVRKMVLSSTFQMDSTPNPAVAVKDPKNTLLHHMPIRRMEAEAIRDHILACSGELKLDLYGLSVFPSINDLPGSRAKPRSGPLDSEGRRSIYIQLRRNFLPSFLRTFDMPNATEPTGQRHLTNVPAQSLVLMNDPFIHQQTKAWAKRIMAVGDSSEERIQILHRQAFAREASQMEIDWSLKVLREFADKGPPEDAWANLCHLMINRKEFIYVY